MVLRVAVSFVVFVVIINSVVCGSLKEVEIIPEEQRTAGAEFLGPSLSLGIGNGGERRGRNYHDKKVTQEDIDQHASGSELLGPSIDLGYGEFGQQQYGEQQKGGESFGRQDAGRSRGEIGFFGNAGRRGLAGHVSEGAYLGNHQAAHGDRAEGGYYGNSQGARKGYDHGGAYAGAQAFNRKGLAAAGIGSKGGHRKGHHSSGFHNTYHKDESGNNTSYYDDAVDNGGHFFYDARDGAYGDRGANGYKGSFQDGAFQANARGNQGRYGAANGYNDARGQKGSYARDQFYDDAHKYGQQKGGERFNKNLQTGQQEEGGAYYGKAGEGYGHVVKDHGGLYGGNIAPKPVPYIPPSGAYDYGATGKDYVPHDYYPVGSYGASSDGGYYDKAGYDTVSAPVYTDDLKGSHGFATYEDSGPLGGDKYFEAKPSESDGYYGIYRGIAY